MAVSKSKPKRKKKYVPRTPCLDPMQKAINGVARLTSEEKGIVTREAWAAFRAIRRGEGNKQAWSYLADAANIGEVLSDMGICSDAPSVQILQDMQQALKSFAERANARGTWTATGPELMAMREGLDRHCIQLDFISLNELRKAVATVAARVQAARAGQIDSVSIIEERATA